MTWVQEEEGSSGQDSFYDVVFFIRLKISLRFVKSDSRLDIKVSTDYTLKCPDLGDKKQEDIMTSLISLVFHD